MTQNPPPVVRKPKKGKKQQKLSPAWATIIAAIISVVGGGFVGAYVFPQNKATNTPVPSPTLTSSGPAALTINEPPTGNIHFKDNYSGNAVNLRSGQLVWTFNQTVSHGDINTKVFPDTGPCTVDYARQQWRCTDVYIGNPTDNKTFMVCAAIIDTQTAFIIVNDLRSGEKDFSLPLSSLPSIHDEGPSCMSVHRI